MSNPTHPRDGVTVIEIDGQPVEVVVYRTGNRIALSVNGLDGTCVWRAAVDPRDGTVYGEDGQHVMYRGVVLRPVDGGFDMQINGIQYGADDLDEARTIVDEVLDDRPAGTNPRDLVRQGFIAGLSSR